MARPRTPIGSHGAIRVTEVTPGRFRARARHRFENGTLKQVERFGTSKAKATHALKTALANLSLSQGVDVKRETNLSDLADRFLAAKADRAPRTVDTYRQTIKLHIKPKLGNLAVAEASTERLGRFLAQVAADHGPGAAKACRSVLSGMMGLAARSDAVRVNPVREVAPIERHTMGATAIPLPQLPLLLDAVRSDARLRELDVADLIEFMAGTGCRVGEVCALSWADIDLEAGTATIRANVVRANGTGLVRQDHPKTKAGVRTIALPTSLIGLLVDRRVKGGPNPHGLVFPTALGNLRDPRNTSRAWADARDRLGFPDVTTHSFRKTVATALDQSGLTAREIAEYLGHQNPSLTQDVYMAKNTGGVKAATAMESLVHPA